MTNIIHIITVEVAVRLQLFLIKSNVVTIIRNGNFILQCLYAIRQYAYSSCNKVCCEIVLSIFGTSFVLPTFSLPSSNFAPMVTRIEYCLFYETSICTRDTRTLAESWNPYLWNDPIFIFFPLDMAISVYILLFDTILGEQIL